MSLSYHAVGWNRQKRHYDFALAIILLVGMAAFAAVTFLTQPDTTEETFIIRFTALTALILLHIILAIGPLSRFDRRFLVLLYNRRHLGVTMFVFAAIHGIFTIIQFHAEGDRNPLVSFLTAYRRDYVSGDLPEFPFEVFGFGALVVFFVMAVTSHDFWLRNLGASFWKTMHMMVYLAYGSVILHVCLGALQSDRSPTLAILLGLGFFGLLALHLAAFARERKRDRERDKALDDGLVKVAGVADLLEGSGVSAECGGERVAVFRKEGRIFAVSNVCRHQGGPLGEGRVVNGCLTCPWHGYQYKLEDGCSPPPFTEVVPTYRVRLVDQDVYVHPTPLPLGTESRGVELGRSINADERDFYIGWQSKSAPRLGRFATVVFTVLLVAVPSLYAIIAATQNPVSPGIFEFGIERTYEGVLWQSPIPLLQVSPEGAEGGLNYLLVGEGKFGPPSVIDGVNGKRVRFPGTLIARNGIPMIQMGDPASFEIIGDAADTNRGKVVSLGRGEYVGELVDTKCFLGVMRPATGKVHRGCAVRCISGGAPPGLLVRDDQGNEVALMLAGSEGKPLDIDAELAARVLKVDGILEVHSGTPILRVDKWTLVDED